jgi:hypothetical protein
MGISNGRFANSEVLMLGGGFDLYFAKPIDFDAGAAAIGQAVDGVNSSSVPWDTRQQLLGSVHWIPRYALRVGHRVYGGQTSQDPGHTMRLRVGVMLVASENRHTVTWSARRSRRR